MMINIENLSYSLNEKTVFNNVNLMIGDGEKIAVIGDNGAGKTTLLELISGVRKADRGSVSVLGTIGYARQNEIFSGTVGDHFNARAAWEIDIALENAGLKTDINFDANLLSGGQKTRLAFARVISDKPDILLLDEPTNNLDDESMQRLISYLAAFNGTVIIASHDRYFINAFAHKILYIENGAITEYRGDYTAYKQAREAAFEFAQKQYDQYDKQRKKLLHEKKIANDNMHAVSNERYNKIKHEGKGGFDFRKNSSQRQFGAKAKAINSALEQLGTVESPRIKKQYKATLNESEIAHKKRLVSAKNIAKFFGEKTVLENISFEIWTGDRIQIAGKNGSGKTTLLKIIAGIMGCDHGEIIKFDGLKIGYLSQDTDDLDEQKSGIDNLAHIISDSTIIYQRATTMNIRENDLKKQVSKLSRGQKTKLAFLKLLLQNMDLIILDEPTNHIDISARENIENALFEYDGAILIASHDRYFVQSLMISSVITLQ